MMTLFKLHYRYLFSKRNLILISAVIMLVIISFFLATKPYASRMDHLLNRATYFYNYFHNAIILAKIFQILLLSFIMGMSFTVPSDSYHIIYLSYKRKRLPFYLSKLTLLMVVGCLVGAIIYLCYLVIGFCFTPWFTWKYEHLLAFGYLLFLSLYYGLVSCVLVFWLKTTLSSIIAFIIYMTSEFFQTLNMPNLNAYLQVIFPSLIPSLDTFTLMYGAFHLIVLISLVIVIGSTFYQQLDLT